MRSGSVTLKDGRRISFERSDGRGAPLVCLHGLLDSGAGWEGLVRATHRPVIAIDLPGFGNSDLPVQPRVAAYASDVIAALDLLKVTEFNLIGHSLGGAVAAHVADRCPERVRSLLLLAPAGFGRLIIADVACLPGVKQALSASLPLFLANPAAVSLTYATMIANRHLPDPKLLARVMSRAQALAPASRMAVEALQHEAHATSALHRRRSRYQGPVSCLWGRHDRLVPLSHQQGVLTSLPQAQIQVVEKMGHHPQVERPQMLSALVERTCSRGRCASRRTRSADRRRRLNPVAVVRPALAG